MKRQKVPACFRWVCIAILLASGGCGAVGEWFKTDRGRFLAPHHVVRKPPRSVVNPIYKGMSVVDTHRELVPNATWPTEDDYKYSKADYLIGPTDYLVISVLDLFQEGMETPLERQVSASGFIDLPLLPQSYNGKIKAEGLNKEQLKNAIASAYSPEVLPDPTVSVSILAKRQSVFSIRGAVARPGTYSIVRKDMRLLESLAMAGDVIQSNIKYIYIIRPRPAVPLEEDKEQDRELEQEPTILPPLPPMPPDAGDMPRTAPATNQHEDVDDGIRELEGLIPGGPDRPEAQPGPSILPMLSESASSGAAADPGAALAREKGHKWTYLPGKDGQPGRWIRVAPGAPTPGMPSPEPVYRPKKPAPRKIVARRKDLTDPYGWKNVDKSDMARIIAIDLPKLNQGDPRMNIVVRDNDVVQVPPLKMGEFYVMGEVLRPGAYSLTGRQVTVKMAIGTAGNLGHLAWPENSILVRRIGDSQEQMIPLDIQAIIRGDDPDVFLKPNDVIMVGTDVRASFFAVLRHAFRMSYGFGFIYDRNFSEPLEGRLHGYNSERFTRF